MTTTFTLNRLLSNAKSTAGQLLGPKMEKMCAIIEDAHRATKVKGETRIPAGLYRLRKKAIGTSRFDASYGKIFKGMHQGMIEICDVPGFEGVLLHCGNTHKDTAGCPLIGREFSIGPEGYQITGGTSQPAYREVYPVLLAAIDKGDAWLNVVDEPAK